MPKLFTASAIKSASVAAAVAVNDAVAGVVIVALPFSDSLTVKVNAPELKVLASILFDVIVVGPLDAL